MYYGCMPEKDDIRDYKLGVKNAKTFMLPDTYEITMPNVKDQGIVNSCVAHSLATFLEETYKDEKLKFSTGFIYGYRPFSYSQNEGMYPREAIKTLLKVGDVENHEFNHNKEIPDIKYVLEKDLDRLKPLAAPFRINGYARLHTKSELKQCLFNDVVVPVSVPVYNDLKLDDRNIVEYPKGECDGYHMLVVYGWCRDGWLIQNSWGEFWGDGGRAILPYDYPIDSAWALSTDKNNITPYNTWWQKIINIIFKVYNFIKCL